jgi:stage II sporulation protein AB (anti-sigma F factor)
MQQVALAFPAVPESVTPARHRMVEFLAEARISRDLVDDCRIVFTEAFTNAVLHGYRGRRGDVFVEFAVEPDGVVAILVADDGDGWCEDSAFRQGGRGMQVIRSLATRCDVTRRDGGGTEVRVWVEPAPAGVDA